MCLLYSILYGCGRPCGQGDGAAARNTCGCAQSAAVQNVCGGCAQNNCARSCNSCCESTYALQAASVQNETASVGCCACRNCCGFGRHGGLNVCGDAAYYCRQYALCCCNSAETVGTR